MRSEIAKALVGTAFAVVAALPARPAQGQSVAKEAAVATAAGKPVLTIVDEAGKSHALSEADLARLPQRKARLPGEPTAPEYEGASLADVLKHVGVEFGEALRGRRTPTVVLCEATDKYRVALSLAEIDPATTDNWVLVAWRRQGQPLAADEGPWRFVVPGDKRKVRCIRMLRTIRVINLNDLPITTEAKPAKPR